MERITTILKLAWLIRKKRLFGLTPLEEEQLDSARKQVLPGKEIPVLSERISLPSLEERYSAVDTDKEWRLFQGRVSKRQTVRMWGIAAGICLLLAGGFTLWLTRPKMSATLLAQEDGQKEISLMLADGRHISLSDTCGNVALDPGTTLHAGSLTYAGDPVSEELQYNLLSIPKGTYYHLVLSDGTKVWLNADSRLHYPIRFGKDCREVSLEGEAYFEVAKDSTRPFFVCTNAIRVKVLGTTFDVNSYLDDGRVYTVLVEGEVAVCTGRQAHKLSPGQIASVDTRKEVPTIQVDSCDTSLYTAWRDGQFRFRNTSLTQILKQISRCYNVSVILEHDYREEYFSGDISYHVSLPSLLEAIEASTSVRFDIEGNTVRLRRK